MRMNIFQKYKKEFDKVFGSDGSKLATMSYEVSTLSIHHMKFGSDGSKLATMSYEVSTLSIHHMKS